MDITSQFSTGISILKNLADTYEGTCLFLCASALAVLILAILSGRKGRVIFLYPTVILSLSVFNPWVLAAIYGTAENSEAVAHAAFFWAVPVVLSIACAAVALSSALRHPVLRLIPIVLVAVFSIATGVPDVSAYQNLTLPDNLLKADPETAALLDYMSDESASDEYRVAFENETMALGAEEYSAEVVITDTLCENDAEEDTETNASSGVLDPEDTSSDPQTSAEASSDSQTSTESSSDSQTSTESFSDADMAAASAVKAAVLADQPDFLVVRTDGTYPAILSDIGLSECAHTEHYSVYKMK